jgi:hypothetical protein
MNADKVAFSNTFKSNYSIIVHVAYTLILIRPDVVRAYNTNLFVYFGNRTFTDRIIVNNVWGTLRRRCSAN